MRIDLAIDTDDNFIELYYSKYNMIKTTLYNDTAPKVIYELLKTLLNIVYNADIKTEEDFKKYLEM